MAHWGNEALKAACSTYKLVPIERPDAFVSEAQEKQWKVDVMAAESEDQIQALVRAAEAQQVLVSQLQSGLQSATKGLTRAIARRKQAADKEKNAAAKSQQDKERAEFKQRAQQAQAKLEFHKGAELFFIQWGSIGHAPMVEFKAEADLTSALGSSPSSGASVLDEPFILRESESWLRATKEGTTLQKTLRDWISEGLGFIKTAREKNYQSVQHLLPAHQGKDDVRVLMSTFIPQKHIAAELTTPSLQADLDAIHLMGYLDTFVRIGYEQNQFGCLRIMTHGSLTVAVAACGARARRTRTRAHVARAPCLNPRSGSAHLPPNPGRRRLPRRRLEGRTGLGRPQPRVFQALRSAEEAQKWHEAGVKLWHGSVAEGQVVYTPPGYMVGAATAAEEPAAALRQHVLPNNPKTISDLTVAKQYVVAGSPAEDALAVILNVMSAKRRCAARSAA